MRAARRWAVLAAAAAVVALAGCSSDDASTAATDDPAPITSTTATTPPTTTGAPTITTSPTTTGSPSTTVDAGSPARLEDRECEPRPDVASACYVLVVPADRADPSGGEVRVAVEVLDTATDPAAVPVVMPGGGPGIPSISLLTDLPAWSTNHDIVLYDHRGTGLSEPSLDCPEYDRAVIDALGAVESTTEEYEATRAALSACRERLEASGVDLDDYDTPANTADLVDLRRALGYDRWAIVGASYGSRVALDTLRTDPDGVAAVVLDSVYPPGYGSLDDLVADYAAAFDRLVAACAASATCTSQHPDLETRFDEVLAQADADPAQAEVTTSDGDTVPVAVTGDVLATAGFAAMYDTATIPQIPLLLEVVAAGDPTVLGLVVDGFILLEASEGTYLSFECADNADLADGDPPTPSDDLVGVERSALLGLGMLYCLDWDVDPVDPAFDEPVESDVPALVLAGALDPITPADTVGLVAPTLDNATVVVLEGHGHHVGLDPCGEELTTAFLADPMAPIDDTCARELQNPFGP